MQMRGGQFVFQKIKALCLRHKDFIAYMFFGAMTTVVNCLVYFPCQYWLETLGVDVCGIELSVLISDVIAWVASVAFAFLTNKPFVFKSHDWSIKVLGRELAAFLGCRIGSLLLELVFLFVTTSLLDWHTDLMKLAALVIVVIINYFGSKLLVFRKKK